MHLFFCFVMKRQIMNITCYYKKICKNTFFLYLFSLLWWKTVYFWLVTALSFTQHFFSLWGLSCPRGGCPPHQYFWVPVKILKKWLVMLRQGRIWMQRPKIFYKKNKTLDFGQMWVNVTFSDNHWSNTEK